MGNNRIQDYIAGETGIVVSKKLLSFIENPQKLNMLRDDDLIKIVIEYKPIFNHFRFVLDDPSVSGKLVIFETSLLCRLEHKPQIKEMLYDDK